MTCGRFTESSGCRLLRAKQRVVDAAEQVVIGEREGRLDSPCCSWLIPPLPTLQVSDCLVHCNVTPALT